MHNRSDNKDNNKVDEIYKDLRTTKNESVKDEAIKDHSVQLLFCFYYYN